MSAAATSGNAGRGARLLAPLALVVLALGANGRSLWNGFAYDDVPMVVENAAVHTVQAPWVYAAQTYWTGVHCCTLYRPLTVTAFAVEWWLGGGAAFVFHAVNLLLLLTLTLLVWRLARTVLPTDAAWVAAAGFAVHPVHVEAVANIVGQSELWMGVWTVATVLVYLAARRGTIGSGAARALLFAGTLAACLSKEQGAVLPVLLLLADRWCLPPEREKRGRRRDLVGASAVAMAFALAARAIVLAGTTVHEVTVALRDAGTFERIRIVIGTAPVWARLMLWPRDLSPEYSPPAYGPALGSGWPLLFGALVIGATAGLFVWCWRTQRPAAFGLAWFAVTLFPVANLATPIGVLVAERTLLVPSIGVLIALGDGFAVLWRAVAARRPARLALGAAALALLAAATARSVSRQAVWFSSATLLRQAPLDAPRSARAHRIYAGLLWDAGDRAGYRAALDRAIALDSTYALALVDRGQVARAEQGCAAAIPYFERALAAEPARVDGRTKLMACLVETGDVQRLEAVAKADRDAPPGSYRFILERARAARSRTSP